MTSCKLKCGLVVALCLMGSTAWADTLELKNGSRIEGTFRGGTETEISFQVASFVQKYNLADIASVNFDSQRAAGDLPARPDTSLSNQPVATDRPATRMPVYVTIPAGTRISV